MQDLRVIGVENGALLVAADDGNRFRIPIDEVLQSRLRQTVPDPGSGRKLAPKDIQAHIRGGMSADEVATLTGVPLEYIQKFEGPVLAEREFVVTTALGVPVHTAIETDPLAEPATFGSVIHDRLFELGAEGERWASWKESGAGWIVKLSFTANEIEHDARWGFEPKKLALEPLNGEAVALSQESDSGAGLIPRLRAVTDDREPDASRFDSGAFDVTDADAPDPRSRVEPLRRPAPAAETPNDLNQTADLLEALRRRRGEREAASFDSDDAGPPPATPAPGTPSPMHPSTGGIRIVDVPLDTLDNFAGSGSDNGRSTAPQPGMPTQSRSARRGRQAMPSWDEIVFGARPDDDLG